MRDVPAYYNEFDPYAAQWLRNLIDAGHIAPGDVDERSIVNVQPDDLLDYSQCHFFAGIGGWSLALRLAGWDDDRPVWTGSCPCQPLSPAARGRAAAEDMWPAWVALIRAARPRAIVGEQVPHGAWWDRASDDLEAMDYSIGAGVLPAIAVGKDHARYRLYFAAYADGEGEPSCAEHGQVARMPRPRGNARKLVRQDGVSPRLAVMRAFGNAIVPQVGAAFVEAVMECLP